MSFLLPLSSPAFCPGPISFFCSQPDTFFYTLVLSFLHPDMHLFKKALWLLHMKGLPAASQSSQFVWQPTDRIETELSDGKHPMRVFLRPWCILTNCIPFIWAQSEGQRKLWGCSGDNGDGVSNFQRRFLWEWRSLCRSWTLNGTSLKRSWLTFLCLYFPAENVF